MSIPQNDWLEAQVAVLGSVLLVGAAVLLITKKRMSAEK